MHWIDGRRTAWRGPPFGNIAHQSDFPMLDLPWLKKSSPSGSPTVLNVSSLYECFIKLSTFKKKIIDELSPDISVQWTFGSWPCPEVLLLMGDHDHKNGGIFLTIAKQTEDSFSSSVMHGISQMTDLVSCDTFLRRICCLRMTFAFPPYLSFDVLPNFFKDCCSSVQKMFWCMKNNTKMALLLLVGNWRSKGRWLQQWKRKRRRRERKQKPPPLLVCRPSWIPRKVMGVAKEKLNN